MTTIQLLARVELDLGHWRDCDYSGVGEVKYPLSKVRVKNTEKTAFFPLVVATVCDWLQHDDTFTEKTVGYSICGLSLVYLAGHMVKAFIS